MKKTVGFVLLLLCNGAFAVGNAVENIQEHCALAKQGRYSEVQGKAQIQADGTVKLASLEGKGEISVSKVEWEGLNRVLKAHQAGDNKDYRACVANALPYFKNKERHANHSKEIHIERMAINHPRLTAMVQASIMVIE